MARRVAGQSTRTGTQGRSLTSRQKYIDDAKKKKKTAARRVAGQSTRTGVQGRSLTSRQKYIESAKKAATTQKRATGGTTSQSAKKTQKQKKSAFATYIENVQKRMSGGVKVPSRTTVYQNKIQQKLQEQKQAATKKEKTDAQKKIDANRGLSLKQKVQTYKDDVTKEYDKIIKAPTTNATKKAAEEAKEKYKEQKFKEDSAKLRKNTQPKLNKTMLKDAQKAVKAAKEKRPEQMTNEEALRVQWAARNPTYKAKKGGDNIITEDLQKKIKKNIQADLDRGSVGTGFMSGSMPVADLKKSVEKKYGVKLDDSKAKEHIGYNISEMAGYLAKSATFSGASEASIAKALTKVVAKKTGKQVTSKAGKFAINRAAEAIASTPINAEDAAKNSENLKEFGKNMAVNAALDAGMGTALDGVSALLKGVNKSKLKSAVVKSKAGKKLDVDEAKELNKFRENAKAAEVLKNAQKKLAGTQQSKVDIKKKTEPTIGGGNNRSLRLNDNPGTPSVANPSSIDNSIFDSAKKGKMEQANIEKGKQVTTGIKAGKVTTIKEPYNGKVPEQKSTTKRSVEVKKSSVEKAQRNITEAGNNKNILRKAYEKIFSDEGGSRTRRIKDVSYDEQPYDVFIGKKAIGKVISDPNMSPEKLAVFDNIDEIIEEAEYVGSGKYIPHGQKKKLTERFDYFETQMRIGDNNYTVSFDVEVFPNTNNYRTHKIIKIDLISTPNADVGPVPTAKGAKSSPIKDLADTNAGKTPTVGQNPTSLPSDLNPFVKNSISDSAQKIKAEEKIADETLFQHARQMREQGFTDADIEDQFYKMGVDSQKSSDIISRKTVSGPADGKTRATKAEEVKSYNPKEYYKSATKGITDEEVGQHYAKLSKQIMEDVDGDENVFKSLELGEKKGIFGKVEGMSQEQAIKQATKEVEENFDDCFRRLMETTGIKQDPHLTEARARVLYDKLADDIRTNGTNNDNINKVMKLMEKTNELASLSGRALNSVKMMLRTTPQGRLRVVDKEVKRLNDRFADRLKGKKLELSDDQIARIMRAESDKEIEKVMEDINTEIWDEIPSTLFEKVNEIRHCSMLFNPKTHLRNLTGNEVFRQARHMSDGIEIGLNKLLKNKIESLGGNVDMVKVARKEIKENDQYLNDMFDMAYKESGSVSRYIESYRPEGSKVVKSGVLNKPIQANYKLLEKEDQIVFKPEYKKNYVRWCKSHNIDLSDLGSMTKKQREAASKYAMERAEIATFRDASSLSNFITSKKSILAGKKGKTNIGTAAYRAGNMLLESQLPFVKTPVNVFRRAVDYSPISLVRATAELAKMKDVEVFKQGIHHLSTGLTGTGVCALGAYLCSKDFITLKAGNVSGDEYYDRDMGYQDFSLMFNVGGKEYSATIDWASPMNVSLFMGAQIYEEVSQRDNVTLTGLLKGIESISGPMLDMSFMSTAKDTVETFMEQAFRQGQGEETDFSGAVVQAIFGSIPQGYLSSFVPQIMSQTAQAFDSKQRDMRSTKEDPLSKSWESWERKMFNKVPGLRNYVLNPKLDRFGNDKETGNNIVLRMVNSFINPSNVKEIQFTDLDREIIKIYNHLPTDTSDEKDAKKYFFYNFTGNPSYDLGDGKRMSYDEAYEYGKSKRREQTTVIENMVKAKSYKNMTWNMKSEEVSNAHWIGQAVADKNTYGYEYAAKRIANTSWEKESFDAYKSLGGTDEKYVDFYINSKRMYTRAHNGSYDYYTKALAVAEYGDSMLAKAYDIHADKMENARAYLKKGGSVGEYSNAMCNVMSGIDKAGVSSSIKNMAISAADFVINSRTRKAMGLTKDKSNMGIGLKKYGYTYESLSKMKMDCKYNFDTDGSGSLNKGEVIDYVNSLGLKNDAEKACVFEYLYDYSGANPWGIPNFLNMSDDGSSRKSGYGSRYGSGYRRRSGGRSGGSSGGSSSTAKSEWQKYVESMQGNIETAKVSHSGTKLSGTKIKTSKSAIDASYDDALRKAVVKLLAAQRKKKRQKSS
ncbi:hypothetical protein LI177_02980 [bacterium 210820-DFI.6.37]|nr:hypothetical protein [bacterium 210820-DFI.6.37]